MEACKEEDHVSLLPDHILASILSYLPISHATQTSVLLKSTPSTSFRRDLQLDSSTFLLAYRSDLKWLALDIARQVDCIIAAHAGQVSACDIVHSKFNPMSNIKRWIQQLSHHRIQHLALICRREPTNCYRAWLFVEEEGGGGGGEERGVLESARLFTGCVHLTTLQLNLVHLFSQVLADIIRCCVALKRLVLCDCLGLRAITIHSATLKGLELKKLAIVGS